VDRLVHLLSGPCLLYSMVLPGHAICVRLVLLPVILVFFSHQCCAHGGILVCNAFAVLCSPVCMLAAFWCAAARLRSSVEQLFVPSSFKVLATFFLQVLSCM
jgi:hypothetical protein